MWARITPGTMTLLPLVICPCCRVLRHPLVAVARKRGKVIHTYRCDSCHCVINEKEIPQRQPEGEPGFSTTGPTPSLEPMPSPRGGSPRRPS